MPTNIQPPEQLQFVEPSLASQLIERAVSNAERAVAHSQRFEEEEIYFGLETKAAYRLIRNGSSDSKLKALMYRPAIEPLLALHRPAILGPAVSPFAVLSAGCALAGKNVRFRTAPSFGRSEDGDVQFEWPFDAHNWFMETKRLLEAPGPSVFIAACVYARTIIGHPLSDANGRLARFFIHAALSRHDPRRFHALALAPAIYSARKPMGQALKHMSNTGGWADYLSIFARAIENAVELGLDEVGREKTAGC